jgi:hypothetical protein
LLLSAIRPLVRRLAAHGHYRLAPDEGQFSMHTPCDATPPPPLVGLRVPLRRARRSGWPHWRREWRWMFGQRRAANWLLASALVLFAGWAAFVQFVRF